MLQLARLVQALWTNIGTEGLARQGVTGLWGQAMSAYLTRPKCAADLVAALQRLAHLRPASSRSCFWTMNPACRRVAVLCYI